MRAIFGHGADNLKSYPLRHYNMLVNLRAYADLLSVASPLAGEGTRASGDADLLRLSYRVSGQGAHQSQLQFAAPFIHRITPQRRALCIGQYSYSLEYVIDFIVTADRSLRS